MRGVLGGMTGNMWVVSEEHTASPTIPHILYDPQIALTTHTHTHTRTHAHMHAHTHFMNVKL